MRASLILLLAIAGCVHPRPSMTRGFGPEVESGFARVRSVTAPFVSLDSAAAAGYPRTVTQCYADEHHGAMGYHHMNRAYLDAKAEVERPEILLYERGADSTYRLNGVEYIVPYRFWPRDSVAPTIMGQTMKRQDGLQVWYLHMWIWRRNPAGLFADYHPDVRCLGAFARMPA